MLDLTIPGKKDGLQTFIELRTLWPEIVAVVTSGYADGPVLAHAEDAGFRGILRKPFTVQDVADLLQKLFPGSD